MKKVNIFAGFTALLFASFSYGQVSTDFAIINPNPAPGPNYVGIGLTGTGAFPGPAFQLDATAAPGVPAFNFDGDNFLFGTANAVTASQYSGAHGQGNTVNNNSNNSFAMGGSNTIDNNSVECFAAGFANFIDNGGHGAIALGGNNRLFNNSGESAAIGEDNEINNGHGSISLGGHNFNDGAYTFTIGQGLSNNIAQSLMAGFNGVPTLFISGAGGVNHVGIGGTTAPAEALHVIGNIRASSLAGGGNVCADINGNLYISGPCGVITGDNLGDHIATMDLQMSCFNVQQSGDINFCNGLSLDQTSYPGELIVQGGPLGIGVAPSTVGLSPGGAPAQLAVAGSIWANGFWYASDERFKENISGVDNAISILDRVNGYKYEYMSSAFPDLNFPEGQTYGFLAQEVKEVLPELVTQGEDGYYAVNYMGMIPVLTEAIKEQQTQIEDRDAQIDDLENQLAAFQNSLEELRIEMNAICENGCADQSAAGSTMTDGASSQLDNNVPNPFNGRTSIGYFVQSDATSAYISINDLNGKFITKVMISDFGVKSSVMIESTNLLNEGIYLYSLVVDNQIIDSKRMIVTN